MWVIKNMNFSIWRFSFIYFSFGSFLLYYYILMWVVKKHELSSVQSLSCVQLFATPWIPARQASLSITNSQSSPKLMSIKSVMPSCHLILCHPLLLLPPIPPSIRVFSNESDLRHQVAKVLELQYQSFQWTPRTDLLILKNPVQISYFLQSFPNIPSSKINHFFPCIPAESFLFPLRCLLSFDLWTS